MIPKLSVKNCITAIVFMSIIGVFGPVNATSTTNDQQQPSRIEETGTIYATDSGVIFDSDSGIVYDLDGDNLLEHAGERALITGSLTTGDNGESILTIDTLEIEQMPVGSEDQSGSEEAGTDTTPQDQGVEVEGSGLENPPVEEQQQN